MNILFFNRMTFKDVKIPTARQINCGFVRVAFLSFHVYLQVFHVPILINHSTATNFVTTSHSRPDRLVHVPTDEDGKSVREVT